jgi:hypothetical protein
VFKNWTPVREDNTFGFEPLATIVPKSATYPLKWYGTVLALSTPKDMLNRFKFGIGNGKQNTAPVLALLLLAIAANSPAKLHAADQHSASARLRIQVTVMPTVVAMQVAQRMQVQPSQSPVTFNLTPYAAQSEKTTTRSVTIPNKNGSSQTAVLQTSTFVTE